jgi:phosphatidylinositol alpha-mannosyltransferase
VIPNGVDTALFGSPSLGPVDRFQEGARILFVGRLEPRKGFGYLLEAYARIQAELPEARLLVVGPYSSGDVRPFERRLRKMSVSGVHFLGCVTEKDLAIYYRNSHVFCAPSTGLESFGMVLLEAMAAGVPIVASDIDGYRAVLKHGAEGLLVPPREPVALADALLHLLRHPETRQAMGQRGQSTAAHYTWERVAAEVLEFYDDVLEKKKAGARVWSGPVHSSATPVVA